MPLLFYEGHLAGDDLIKRAVKTLKSVFKGNDIFRVGGDEFVIIIIGAEEERIVESLDKLRKEVEKNKVSFAAGYALSDNDRDIEKALKEADFNMYKDKRKFYNQ